jgi:hypothetical protein
MQFNGMEAVSPVANSLARRDLEEPFAARGWLVKNLDIF